MQFFFYSRSEKTGIFSQALGGPEDTGKLVRGHCRSPDKMTGRARAEGVKGKADRLRDVWGVALTRPADGLDT